jgi:hypothetical protein
MKLNPDRVTAALSGLVMFALVAYLLVRNQPMASPQLFFALRVVLSLLSGILGATIPGFLNLKWSGGGLVIRAGGALALFVLTFVYTPNLLTHDDKGGSGVVHDQKVSNGVAIGRDNVNSPITINPAPHSQPCRDPSHGIERYQRVLPPVVITSEEMGGGHTQPEWCNRAIQSLAGTYRDGRFTVLSSGESTQNHCPPFNCPQYTYTCTIQVQADPVYKSAIGPECP